MKRPGNWEELLNTAKKRPDLLGALERIGVDLQRCGTSRDGGIRYRVTGRAGIPGDYSAVTFIHNPSGIWLVIDNKERTGFKYMNAIDTLMNLYNTSFDDAVYLLSGGTADSPAARAIVCDIPPAQTKPKELTMPSADYRMVKRIIAYLVRTRCIPYNVIKELVRTRLIYPSPFTFKGGYENTVCTFPVLNEKGKPAGAEMHGVSTDFPIKAIAPGSDPEYAWGFMYGIQRITPSTPVYFCESGIDAISLLSLYAEKGAYVSVTGVKDVTFNSMKEKLGGIPIICVDDDEAGEKFRKKHIGIKCKLPSVGSKDWNEMLQKYHRTGAEIPISYIENVTLFPLFEVR